MSTDLFSAGVASPSGSVEISSNNVHVFFKRQRPRSGRSMIKGGCRRRSPPVVLTVPSATVNINGHHSSALTLPLH